MAAVEGLQQGFINVVGGSVAEPGDYNLFQGAVADDPYLFPHKSQNMHTLWVDNHVNQVHRNKVFDMKEILSLIIHKGHYGIPSDKKITKSFI